MRFPAFILAAGLTGALGFSVVACHPAAKTDMETLEYARSMISLDGEPTARVIGGDQVEVIGLATNHDKFQHDVFFTAALFDAGGKQVGSATGKLEDWPAGHRGAYKLLGSTKSPNWSRVTVVVSNVYEHVIGQPEQ
ncbi:MAG TPA: FxLYD domain-containing protein [Bryobacteraceae bacterium]|nr:FxLYD domain-containing protein [Bryobacteraceae bacterium]